MDHRSWHRDRSELEEGLEALKSSPHDEGVVAVLVRRPGPGLREELEEARIDVAEGLVGDDWSRRPSPNPLAQLTFISVKAIALLAATRERWSLAGDQIFVEMDLSEKNLPPGSRVAVGTAEVEITAEPHLGCRAFTDWFGPHATALVNSERGRALRLRGVNARVVQGGVVRVGDQVRKL